MLIRELNQADAQEYHQLRLRALKEHPEAFADSYELQLDTPLETVKQFLREASASQDVFVLGCFVEDRLIGTAYFSRRSWPKKRHQGVLMEMHVASEQQGHGYGRALLSESIQRARGIPGLERLILSVEAKNEVAKKLYESMGFKTFAVEQQSMYLNGVYHDEEIMVLILWSN